MRGVTKLPSDEKILSDEQVAQVEAAAKDGFSVAPGTGVALCATVKHLRAERDALRDSASIVAFQAHQIDGKIAESLIEQGARLQREADAKLVEGYHECPSTNDYNIAAAIRASALEKL